MNAKITATAHNTPKKVMTNHDLEKIVDTSDEWITERTGIKQRHFASKGQLTSDLAYNAAKEAIVSSGINKAYLGNSKGS